MREKTRNKYCTCGIITIRCKIYGISDSNQGRER